MAKIKIDENEYDTEEMPQEALSQIQAIQFIDGELARLQLRGAALQTARNAYIRAAKEVLEKGGSEDDDEATIDLPDDLNFD